MKTKGALQQRSTLGGDNLWELTLLHVNNIVPSLQSKVFPDQDSEQSQNRQSETGGDLGSDQMTSFPSSETLASQGSRIGC